MFIPTQWGSGQIKGYFVLIAWAPGVTAGLSRKMWTALSSPITTSDICWPKQYQQKSKIKDKKSKLQFKMQKCFTFIPPCHCEPFAPCHCGEPKPWAEVASRRRGKQRRGSVAIPSLLSLRTKWSNLIIADSSFVASKSTILLSSRLHLFHRCYPTFQSHSLQISHKLVRCYFGLPQKWSSMAW